MLFKVLGVETSNGEFRGNQYSGRNVYVLYPDSYTNDRLVGQKCERLWVPDRLGVGPLRPDDMIDVFYNKYGRIDSIELR